MIEDYSSADVLEGRERVVRRNYAPRTSWTIYTSKGFAYNAMTYEAAVLMAWRAIKRRDPTNPWYPKEVQS